MLVVLAPAWWFGFSGGASHGLLRVAAATASTVFLVAAVVRDLRGQRPFHRGFLFPAANVLLLASWTFPRFL